MRSSPVSVSQSPLVRVGAAGVLAPLVPTLVSGDDSVEGERGAVVPAIPAVSPLVPVEGPRGAPMFEPDCSCPKAGCDKSAAAASTKRSLGFMGVLL
jgi:hypothetical protein